jgi:hypothetical protein
MPEPLLPERFLFRFTAACRYRKRLWTGKRTGLDETYRLASFTDLENRPTVADVRTAWSEAGLLFSVRVTGKKQTPWCRVERTEESDGLHLWIDTRDVHNVHRAGRFCHRLVFLPFGGGSRRDLPVAEPLPIRRAKAPCNPIHPGQLKVRSEKRVDGYVLEAFVPADALTGFDPTEHPRLGFTYAVIDRELGEQTFGVGAPMPYQEDPSLWATLELTR